MRATDRQLLIRTHKGDGPAAEALWARFSPRLWAYARAIVRNPETASDIVQTVFLQLLAQPRSTIRSIDDVTSWMVRLTRNVAISHFRSERRSSARLRRLPVPQNDVGPDGEPWLRDALDAIPRRDREIVVLKHIAGLTFDQISLALRMNRNTAASRYRAAIDRLRNDLEPEPDASVGAAR